MPERNRSFRSSSLIGVVMLMIGLGLLFAAPAAQAQGSIDDNYGGIEEEGPTGEGTTPQPRSGAQPRSGGDSPSSDGGSSGSPSTGLGPSREVTGVGSVDSSSDDSSADSDGALAAGALDLGGGGSGGESEADSGSRSREPDLGGRSLGQLLSGGTKPVAVAKPVAPINAGNEGGSRGLLWLLLALGVVTAVAAGGIAARRLRMQRRPL